MSVEQAINILLADSEYSQYLAFKRFLEDGQGNGVNARVLWCGEPDRYLQAIQSDVYDLVLMECSPQTLLILNQLDSDKQHSPVVMLADDVCDSLLRQVRRFGAWGLLDRRQPDINVFHHYVMFATAYHAGDLSPSTTQTSASISDYGALTKDWVVLH